MSKKQCLQAVLKGYQGPFFPKELETLHQKMFGTKDHFFSGAGVTAAFETFASFRGLCNTHTEDGYEWPQAVRFEEFGTNILILFPRAEDFTHTDGCSSGRLSALYSRDALSKMQLRSLVVSLNHAWDMRFPP